MMKLLAVLRSLDRTLSREVARAIRFYLSHPEAATTRQPVEQDMHAP